MERFHLDPPIEDHPFVFDFESGTNQVMFYARFAGGHTHRTSLAIEDLDYLIESAVAARRKWMA
jgi:hypothetical protein